MAGIFRAEASVNLGDDLEPIGAGQIIIRHNQIEAHAASGGNGKGLIPIAGGERAKAAAVEKQFERIADFSVVFDNEYCVRTAWRRTSDAIRFCGARAFKVRGDWRRRVDQRHIDREDRAPANARADADRRFEQVAKTLDDGKTKAKPLRAFARMVVQLMKLFEDRAEFGFRYSRAGVPDFDA